jgi:hypothetical protein
MVPGTVYHQRRDFVPGPIARTVPVIAPDWFFRGICRRMENMLLYWKFIGNVKKGKTGGT